MAGGGVMEDPWVMLADLLEHYCGVRPETGDTQGTWGEKIRPAWERMQKEKSRITFHVDESGPLTRDEVWDARITKMINPGEDPTD
jgi:hypothetical protein